MAVAQTRNAEHIFLETADLLPQGDRNFIFEAYDTAVNVFTSTEVQAFNTVRLNTAPEIYDFTSNILTIIRAGIYLLSLHIALESTAEAAAAVYLEEDPDTGVFATVPGSTIFIAMPSGLRQSGHVTIPLRVGFDYRYRVSLLRTSGAGNISTIGSTPAISALCLFQNG